MRGGEDGRLVGRKSDPDGNLNGDDGGGDGGWRMDGADGTERGPGDRAGSGGIFEEWAQNEVQARRWQLGKSSRRSWASAAVGVLKSGQRTRSRRWQQEEEEEEGSRRSWASSRGSTGSENQGQLRRRRPSLTKKRRNVDGGKQNNPKVGKTLLIKSLVKHYTKHNLSDVRGPITVVSGVEKSGQQSISMAEEYKEWGSKTTLGVLGGMLYGGFKEGLASAHFGDVLAPMQEGKDLKTKRFMWRELMEQRVIRITRGSVLGGARLGTFTALFCGIQGWLAVDRNVHDTLNVVAAGSVTAASFGLALRGSFLTRVRAAAIGSLLGATICLPLGYLQTTLQRQVEDADKVDAAPLEVRETDGIAATIRRLEKSLSESEALESEKR